MTRAIAAVTALALGGCSWLFLDTAPKSATPATALECDDDSRLPLVDGSLALAGYGAFTGMLAGAIYLKNEPVGGVLAIGSMTSILGGFVLAFASRYGEREVHRCARLKRGYPS